MEPSSHNHSKAPLPPIPAKRYFTIGEVSELCGAFLLRAFHHIRRSGERDRSRFNGYETC